MAQHAFKELRVAAEVCCFFFTPNGVAGWLVNIFRGKADCIGNSCEVYRLLIPDPFFKYLQQRHSVLLFCLRAP